MEEEKKSLIEKGKKINKKYLILAIIVIIVIIDQTSKIVVKNMGEISVIPGVLTFRLIENTNSAYGIGSNSTIMYVLTNLVILGVIFKFLNTQNEYVDTKMKVFLTFILAGGIANVIDRVIRGYVIEFIDFSQIINLPIFNIADIFVLIGWVAIAGIFAVFTVNEWRNNKTKKKE